VLHDLAPEISTVNVKAIFDKVREQLNSSNTQHTIKWLWRGQRQSVACDIFCTQMILSNLLSNAYKVVPKVGIIQVTLNVDETYWTLTVEDNGPGIAQEEKEKVFKPFYQGTQTKRGSLKGNGIGLSIVRECVQKLNGRIEIQSSSLGGACFRAVFPITQTTEVRYVEASYSAG